MMERPVSSCCSSVSSRSTTVTASESRSSALHVSRCSSLIARSALSDGIFSVPFAIDCSPASSRRFVVLPMADMTTQGRWSGKEAIISATSRMRFASATDEPPNLYTTEICT